MPITQASLNDVVTEEIRVALARRRMSARQLALLLGENEMWMSRRMRGAQVLDLSDLERIAVALELEAADLLPRPGEVTRRDPSVTGNRPPDRRPPGHPSLPGLVRTARTQRVLAA